MMKLHKENQDCPCISSLVELASPMLELTNKQRVMSSFFYSQPYQIFVPSLIILPLRACRLSLGTSWEPQDCWALHVYICSICWDRRVSGQHTRDKMHLQTLDGWSQFCKTPYIQVYFVFHIQFQFQSSNTHAISKIKLQVTIFIHKKLHSYTIISI